MCTFVLLVLSFLTSSQPRRVANDHRAITTSGNGTLVERLRRLHQLSLADVNKKERNSQIAVVVNAIPSSEDLYRIALLARSMMTGLAEDEDVDEVYWTAFWLAAEKLSSRTDAESVTRLELLEKRADLGGGDRVLMEELLHRQLVHGSHK